jgi:hypothetical protein
MSMINRKIVPSEDYEDEEYDDEEDLQCPNDPYVIWDMDRPEPGEEDPFEDYGND